MMRWAIASTILLIGAMVNAEPGLAPSSAQYQACSKNAKTQLAFDKCASNELALRNKQMQSVYAQILLRSAVQPAKLSKIKTMQGAWLTYVSAYLDATYPAVNKQAEYGSIYPMEVDLARSALIQWHIRDLQALLLKH